MPDCTDFFAAEFGWLAGSAAAPAPPATPFDPLGDWTQGWAIWELAPERRRAVVTRVGALALRRSRLTADRFRLAIRVAQEQLFHVAQATEAAARCRLDAVATPLHWWARTRVRSLDAFGSADPLFSLDVEGRRVAEAVELEVGGVARRLPVAGELALDWGLYEAVSRLDGELAFTAVHEFDSLLSGQRLRPLGTASSPFGELDGFVRSGAGGLPTSYWRGSDRRLLLVRQGWRAFTAEAPAWERSAGATA